MTTATLAKKGGPTTVALTGLDATTLVATDVVNSQTIDANGFGYFAFQQSSYGGATFIGQSVTWFLDVSHDGSTWAALRKIDGVDTFNTGTAGTPTLVGGHLGFNIVAVSGTPTSRIYPVTARFLRARAVPSATVAAGNPIVIEIAKIILQKE